MPNATGDGGRDARPAAVAQFAREMRDGALLARLVGALAPERLPPDHVRACHAHDSVGDDPDGDAARDCYEANLALASPVIYALVQETIAERGGLAVPVRRGPARPSGGLGSGLPSFRSAKSLTSPTNTKRAASRNQLVRSLIFHAAAIHPSACIVPALVLTELVLAITLLHNARAADNLTTIMAIRSRQQRVAIVNSLARSCDILLIPTDRSLLLNILLGSSQDGAVSLVYSNLMAMRHAAHSDNQVWTRRQHHETEHDGSPRVSPQSPMQQQRAQCDSAQRPSSNRRASEREGSNNAGGTQGITPHDMQLPGILHAYRELYHRLLQRWFEDEDEVREPNLPAAHPMSNAIQSEPEGQLVDVPVPQNTSGNMTPRYSRSSTERNSAAPSRQGTTSAEVSAETAHQSPNPVDTEVQIPIRNSVDQGGASSSFDEHGRRYSSPSGSMEQYARQRSDVSGSSLSDSLGERNWAARLFQMHGQRPTSSTRRYPTPSDLESHFVQAAQPPASPQRRRRQDRDVRFPGNFSGGTPTDVPPLYHTMRHRRRNGAASELSIRDLPIRQATPGGPLVKCCICLCEVESGETIRILPCTHQYHMDCIDTWLRINGCCPIDKSRVD